MPTYHALFAFSRKSNLAPLWRKLRLLEFPLLLLSLVLGAITFGSKKPSAAWFLRLSLVVLLVGSASAIFRSLLALRSPRAKGFDRVITWLEQPGLSGGYSG